jgi:hypothetical protein
MVVARQQLTQHNHKVIMHLIIIKTLNNSKNHNLCRDNNRLRGGFKLQLHPHIHRMEGMIGIKVIQLIHRNIYYLLDHTMYKIFENEKLM